jgi:Tfp pilus assembly protein PilP
MKKKITLFTLLLLLVALATQVSHGQMGGGDQMGGGQMGGGQMGGGQMGGGQGGYGGGGGQMGGGQGGYGGGGGQMGGGQMGGGQGGYGGGGGQMGGGQGGYGGGGGQMGGGQAGYGDGGGQMGGGQGGYGGGGGQMGGGQGGYGDGGGQMGGGQGGYGGGGYGQNQQYSNGQSGSNSSKSYGNSNSSSGDISNYKVDAKEPKVEEVKPLYESKADEGSLGTGTAFEVFRSKTYVKNPLELRDPFKRKINKKKGVVQGKSKIPGLYQNIDTNIENKSVESIRIVGVLIGDERRALARIAKPGSSGSGGAGNKEQTESAVFYLKEGMRVGPNGAEVKAIVPGGVVLVEKIRNVYDQDEYLETVIPVSSD